MWNMVWLLSKDLLINNMKKRLEAAGGTPEPPLEQGHFSRCAEIHLGHGDALPTDPQ